MGYGKRNMPDTPSDLVSLAASLPSASRWVIIMAAGGHFAAAVYNGSNIVVRKTFHRYVVRAKRGTVQSVRDAAQGGSAPKSAGSNIRRQQERQLTEEIH